MKYLTTNHYNGYEFELSYEIDGVFKKDVYISIDPLDYSIHGLPTEVENYRELIATDIIDNWGDIIEDLRDSDQLEYDAYVVQVLGE